MDTTAQTATFTGLTVPGRYAFSVTATNAARTGPAGLSNVVDL